MDVFGLTCINILRRLLWQESAERTLSHAMKTLIKNGYRVCGTIYLENGDERIAFQKEQEN